jgi:hypothetical protein
MLMLVWVMEALPGKASGLLPKNRQPLRQSETDKACSRPPCKVRRDRLERMLSRKSPLPEQ